MASPSSSSSSSKHTQHTSWKPGVKLNAKKLPIIDDYINSYFATNLLKPEIPHLNKPTQVFYQPVQESEPSLHSRSENYRRSRTQSKTEAEKINELAKEMDRMLSRAKSKRQTNDLLKLFKNTLSNYVVPEHPMDGNNSHDRTDSNLKRKREMSLPTTPTYQKHHQHYRHHQYQHHKSQELEEINPSEQNLFSDCETSMTMTTTTTRCHIKEPKVNVLESSKTNILHRCYGKQSVKALPQIYKSRKKNNSNVTNCHKPPQLRVKGQKMQIQQQAMNQQMKTIYENDQFDKSKKLVSKNCNNAVGIVTDNSTSISSLNTDKQSNIEMLVSKEMANDNSHRHLLHNYPIPRSRSRKPTLKLIHEKNKEQLNKRVTTQTTINMNVEQDNSIVQRLTSFWNKKLNVIEQTKSMTDQSSISSSLTSVYEEDKRQRENNSNENDRLQTSGMVVKSEQIGNKLAENSIKIVEPCNDRGDVNFGCNENKLKNTNTEKIQGKERFFHNESELPDLKMGLMNELLKVLRKRDDRTSGSKEKKADIVITKNVSDSFGDCMNSEMKLSCVARCKSHVSVEIDDTGDESSNFDSDDFNDFNDDCPEECDEQMLQVIEECLLDDINKEGNNRDIEDYFKEEKRDNVTVNELNDDCQESNDRVDIKENESDQLKIEMEKKCENVVTKFNEPKAVITNVNSIITNLKQLIYTIESIPDELKSVDMNLNCLPVPDRIRNRLSVLMKPHDYESVDDRLSIIRTVHEINKLPIIDTPIEQQQLFRCYSSGKLIGYTKREGFIYMLYFPKMLMIPTVENVRNPFQKISFPKRNELLKALKNQSFNNLIRSHGMEMIVKQTANIDFNKIGDVCVEEAEKDYEEELEVKRNDEITLVEDNRIFKVDSQNIERADGRMTEKTKSRTANSSIIYVSSNPNCTISTLRSLKKSSDNFLALTKNETGFKSDTARSKTIFLNINSSLNLNIDDKCKIKSGGNSFIENNVVSGHNSVEELSDRTSGVSSTPSNSNHQEEFNMFIISNLNNSTENSNCFKIENDIIDKENRVNLDENVPILTNDLSSLSRVNLDENIPLLSNDLSSANRRYNNNIRRRRYRIQNHTEDDNILAGGSGDTMQNCGDVIVPSPVPCHNTSSMSVVVSNSLNDSNSQPDININESELNLSRMRIYGHCSMTTRSQLPQESDNFSTCDVIQEERSDEQISDIDDCVMIEEHSNKKEITKSLLDSTSSISILSRNINLSKEQENKNGTLDSESSKSSSSQNMDFSSNKINQKNTINSTSSTSTLSQNMKSSCQLKQDNIPEDEVESNSSVKKEISGKISDQKFSFLNSNKELNEETNCVPSQNLTNNYKKDINLSKADKLNCKESDDKRTIENICDHQFNYQNLKNLLHEEIVSVSQNSSDSCVEDVFVTNYHQTDRRETNEESCDKEYSDKSGDIIEIKKESNKNADKISCQPEIKLYTSSLVPEKNNPGNISSMTLSQQNINVVSNVSNSNNLEDDSTYRDNNSTENYSVDGKHNFHHNFQAYYFETEISKEAQLAIANKTIKHGYNNDLEVMLRNDKMLKAELTNIIDVDNLCEKEKQLIAACLCLMNRNYYNKQPQLLNLSVANLNLNSSLTSLWNKTSQTMCNKIQLAKKSLNPYDIQTDEVLYQRCYRKLLKAFYTLFVSLLLIFVIQKHFCGIALPIRFPW